MPKTTTVMVLVLVVVLVAFLFPTFMNSPTDAASTNLVLNEEERTEVTDKISIYTKSINADNTTLQITNANTSESLTNTILEGSNATYSFAEGNITVNVLSLGSSTANIGIEHPRTFGWHSGIITILEYLPLLLSSVGVAVIVFLGGKMVIE